MINIITSTQDHINFLMQNLSPEDKKEIEDFGITCEEAILRSFNKSIYNNTIMINNKVAAVFGCIKRNDFFASPWMMTTLEINNINPLSFFRVYKSATSKMLNLFPNLVNYVSADHSKAIRMLKLAGYEIHPPEKYGNGLFCKYSISARV